MDKITRETLKKLSEENPRTAISVYSEFMSPRELTENAPKAIGGIVPHDWDGSRMWIAWPGISCKIEEKKDLTRVGPC